MELIFLIYLLYHAVYALAKKLCKDDKRMFEKCQSILYQPLLAFPKQMEDNSTRTLKLTLLDIGEGWGGLLCISTE